MIEIVVIFIEYFASSSFFKDLATGEISEIKINFRLYPRHYCMPPSWIRKLFKLPKVKIPKFLLIELYFSVFFGILAPITSVVLLFTHANHDIVYVLLLFPAVFRIIELPIFFTLCHIFKKH